MKFESKFIVLTVFFVFGFVLVILGIGKSENTNSSQLQQPNLNVKISSYKDSYIQGEVVRLNIEITNNESFDVFLRGTDAKSGYVKIFVSSDDQNFRQYDNGKAPPQTLGKITLKAGENVKSQAALLWNFSLVGRVADLSDYRKNYILTDYAFPEPGVYFVKAKLIIPGETMHYVESEPIQIVVNEPVGDDLKVWNLIKNKGEIGHFIQQDEFRTGKEEEKDKLLGEIEQIIAKYPNSHLAGKMKQSVENFRASEVKRKEFMENLKRRQKN